MRCVDCFCFDSTHSHKLGWKKPKHFGICWVKYRMVAPFGGWMVQPHTACKNIPTHTKTPFQKHKQTFEVHTNSTRKRTQHTDVSYRMLMCHEMGFWMQHTNVWCLVVCNEKKKNKHRRDFECCWKPTSAHSHSHMRLHTKTEFRWHIDGYAKVHRTESHCFPNRIRIYNFSRTHTHFPNNNNRNTYTHTHTHFLFIWSSWFCLAFCTHKHIIHTLKWHALNTIWSNSNKQTKWETKKVHNNRRNGLILQKFQSHSGRVSVINVHGKRVTGLDK